MALVQLSKRTYECPRVPRGEEPVFEFQLELYEQIVGIERQWDSDSWYAEDRRKTVDYSITVWVAVRL